MTCYTPIIRITLTKKGKIIMEIKKEIKQAAKIYYFILIFLMAMNLCKVGSLAIEFFNKTPEIVVTTQNQIAEFFLVHFPPYAVIFVLTFLIMMLMYSFMKKETPFMDKVVSRLNIIGWYLVVASLVPRICVKIYSHCFSEVLMDGTRALADRTFGIIAATMALLILFLEFIFKYGIQLQQESDETL